MTNAEKVQRLCELIMGGMTKTDAIKQVFGHGMKLWEVVHDNPDFQRQIAQAQDAYADFLVDEALQIVDTDKDPQRAKNRADHRRWLAAKMKPRTYGDRVELAVQQTISVSDALSEARTRVLRVVDRPVIQDAEIVPSLSDHTPVDIQPDIFS